MPHSTSETLKVIYAKGLANHREFDNHFYMSFNKIVKNEFLAVEDISSINDGKLRYEMFVKAYNETREHGGINGLTPSEMFLQRLIKSDTYAKKKQEGVTHVGKQNCYLSL